ncbi:trypco2 family protein [Micromonospora noduli]|uniref:trypco2 family protein n=1 Tax=Micromonospora noduli TaxID=709876 RepID=UPI001CEDE476
MAVPSGRRPDPPSARHQPSWRSSSLELEFAVTLTRQGGGNAGVKVMVLEAGVNTAIATERVHRLTVTLEPTGDTRMGSTRGRAD